MLRDMFKKTYTLIDTKYKNHSKNEPNIPEGLWRKCKKCGQPVYGEDVKNNDYICPKCKAYFRVTPTAGSIWWQIQEPLRSGTPRWSSPTR